MTSTREDVEQLLDTDPAGLWVELDVVCEALGIGPKRAYQLRRSEGWRTQDGQYNFHDITRTWRQRKAQP